MDLKEVYSLKEASAFWNVSDSNLRNALGKFNRFEKQIEECTVKKSEGTWIVMKKAMEEVFGKMKMYKNINTGAVLNAQELRDLHIREYKDMWNDKCGLADEFETEEEFIKYMLENDIDNDFELINDEK